MVAMEIAKLLKKVLGKRVVMVEPTGKIQPPSGKNR